MLGKAAEESLPIIKAQTATHASLRREVNSSSGGMAKSDYTDVKKMRKRW
jgi:hypothetical protein